MDIAVICNPATNAPEWRPWEIAATSYAQLTATVQLSWEIAEATMLLNPGSRHTHR